MFYCGTCQKQNEWPETIFMSQGRCEVCGKTAVCFDTPSSALPLPKRNVSDTVEGMNLAKLGARGLNWKRTAGLERSIYFDIAHMHAEVSECFEALRDAEVKSAKDGTPLDTCLQETWDDKGHPEGFGIELADVVLIAAVMAHRCGVDLEKMIEVKMSFNEEKTVRKAYKK